MSTEEDRINSVLDGEANLDSQDNINAQFNRIRGNYGRFEELSRMQERRLSNPANRDERHNIKCQRYNILQRVNRAVGGINEVGGNFGMEPFQLYDIHERPSLESAMEARRNADRDGEYYVLDECYGSAYDYSSDQADDVHDANYVPSGHSRVLLRSHHVDSLNRSLPPRPLVRDRDMPSGRINDSFPPPPMTSCLNRHSETSGTECAMLLRSGSVIGPRDQHVLMKCDVGDLYRCHGTWNGWFPRITSDPCAPAL